MNVLPWGRIAASAALINSDKKLLLLKRLSTEETFPDCWTFPSGGVEDTDATVATAVTREVSEETGLDFNPTARFGFYEVIVGGKRCMALVHTGTYSGTISTQPSEVADFGWFSYDEAMILPLAFAYREVIIDLYKAGLIA
jgi:8-oxo-dGTP pyrophosphatase MutT (NUDIX family)